MPRRNGKLVSSPKAPDPAATAAAQGQWNTFTAQQQQQMNMIGQDTPWGSLEYNQTGTNWMTDPSGRRVETPAYTAKTTLTPEQQAIFENQQQANTNLSQIAADQSARVGEILNDPFKFDNHDAENWSYDLAAQRILPQQQQQMDALRTQLINQGLRPGTSAWDSEMARQTNANGDQLNQLALTGRSQAFSEALAQRNQPLNEIIGLTSGTQIQNPTSTFAQTPQTQVGGVDYTGLVNQKYQADVSQNNAMMGGLFGLASAPFQMFKFSDRRLKRDIRRIGQTDAGTPLYLYRYHGDAAPHIGVMADELVATQPQAIGVHPSGFLMVDYGKVK